MQKLNEYVQVAEAASLLGVSQNTLRAWAEDGFLIRVRPDPEHLVSAYLAAYVTTHQYWNWVQLNSMRSGQPGINGNEFATLPLYLPPVPEQTAIAEVLSDMDAELSALEERRDKTRDLKQGMMQELLTGKTRLI